MFSHFMDLGHDLEDQNEGNVQLRRYGPRSHSLVCASPLVKSGHE